MGKNSTSGEMGPDVRSTNRPHQESDNLSQLNVYHIMVCEQSMMIGADDFDDSGEWTTFVREGKTVAKFKTSDVNAIVKNPAGYDVNDYV